jgi:hypothetical protein
MPVKDPERLKELKHLWYQRNKEVIRSRKKHRLSIVRDFVIKHKEDNPTCVDCKIDYPPYALDFDHLPGFTKKFALSCSGTKGRKIESIKEEIDKCELVCSNCHRHRTYLRRNEKRILKSRT